MRAREGRAVDLLSTVLLYRIQLQNLSGMKQFQILNCLLARQLASLIEQSSARINNGYRLTHRTGNFAGRTLPPRSRAAGCPVGTKVQEARYHSHGARESPKTLKGLTRVVNADFPKKHKTIT